MTQVCRSLAAGLRLIWTREVEMHQGWLLIGLSLAYLGLLFLIAYVADKNKRRRPKGQPLLYSLSLAVYCTSWTFFGTVGQASGIPWSPVPIYLGPMLVFLFGWRLLARLILVAKREHHLHRRFHCRPLWQVPAPGHGDQPHRRHGILPYLVLQLKAIVTGLDLLMANSTGSAPPATWRSWRWGHPVAGPVQHSVWHPNLDATEHHRGMVVAIAFESVVKLLAFMAVGGLCALAHHRQTERGAYPGGGRLPRCGGGGDAGRPTGARHLHPDRHVRRHLPAAPVSRDRGGEQPGQDLHWARWIFPSISF